LIPFNYSRGLLFKKSAIWLRLSKCWVIGHLCVYCSNPRHPFSNHSHNHLPKWPPHLALMSQLSALSTLNFPAFPWKAHYSGTSFASFSPCAPPVLRIFHTWRVNHSHVWAKLQEQLCWCAGKHEEKHTTDTKSYNSRNVDSAKGWTVGIPKCVLCQLLELEPLNEIFKYLICNWC